MDAKPQIATVNSSPRASIIEPHLLQTLGEKTSTLVGVVTALEVRRDHKQTIVSVDVGEAEDLILLVRNSAGAFLGRLVLIDGKAKRIFHNSAQRFGFPILNCLSVPTALKSRGIALPKVLSSGRGKAVRDTFRPKEDVERERHINQFRNGYRDKLSTGKLIELIPNLSGREKADAENLAALRILQHASRSGDCTLAGPLVKAVHHQKRQRLIDWFARYSPISVNQSKSKRGFRANLRKNEDGVMASFQLERAQRYPFNR